MLTLSVVLNSLVLNSGSLPVHIFYYICLISRRILIMLDSLSFAVSLVSLAFYSVTLILISHTK